MRDLEETRQRSDTQQLIARVLLRLRLASFGRTWASALSVLVAVCCAVLLIRRLGGLGPEWFSIQTLAGIPIGAALIGILFSRKPTRLEAARRIDKCSGENDLFLTLTQLDSSAGSYQRLVLEQAALRAAEIVPGTVASWNWKGPVVRSLIMVGVLFSAVLLVPQFDPFGLVNTATATVAVRKELQETRRETRSRIAELTLRRQSGSLTEETDKALSMLAEELQQLRDDRSALEARELLTHQREVERQWRDLRSSDEISRLLEQSAAIQSFGPVAQQVRQWAKELSVGNTESFDEAFDSLQESINTLSSVSDEDERRQLEQEVRKKLAELQRFAENQLQSKPMESAIRRAMSQLDSARLDPNLRSEATDAAGESLELAEVELAEVAQKAELLASLEQALGAIQSAKQLTPQSPGDDSALNESTVQDFVDQYAKLQGDAKSMQQDQDARQTGSAGGDPNHPEQQASSSSQSGSGASGEANAENPNSSSSSTKGRSQGHVPDRSSLPPENNLANTNFRDAREAASVDSSRRLMTLRRQGLSGSGSSSLEYQQLVRDLRKRVSTAIEVEEIPPGYVTGIRNYFDSLEQQSGREDSGREAAEPLEGSRNIQETDEDADEVP